VNVLREILLVGMAIGGGLALAKSRCQHSWGGDGPEGAVV